MQKQLLPYAKVPQLAKTDIAYATQDPALHPFYEYEPALESFERIIAAKQSEPTPRELLADIFAEQYNRLNAGTAVLNNISALRTHGTFTVTTAHQPSLFLGPLYFLYKALTTINLASQIEQATGNKIVPVFVLGSEDHDLDELNKINLYNKQIVWESPETGAVGSMSTSSVQSALLSLQEMLGTGEAAVALFEKVEKAYSESEDFAAATQALLHELFGRFGLLVLNMNHAALKRLFIPVIKAELLEQKAAELVGKTIQELNQIGFKTQAAPREINLFYMRPGMRERIVLEEGIYKVLNTDLQFSKEAMLQEVDTHPEHFSPNVVLRPLFQEMILPNLAYVGGGGELAYWLERKRLFEHFGVNFPALIRRNSALWLDKDSVKKLEKFGFSASEFFAPTDSLVRAYVDKNAGVEVSLKMEISALQDIYEQVAQKAASVDATLDKAVRAEAVKAAAALEQWESRLVRAEKQKHEVVLNQLRNLKEKLYPNNGLQERTDNFIPYLIKYGEGFIDTLQEAFDPFEAGFVILAEV